MHLEHANSGYTYRVGEERLESSPEKRHLGVVVGGKLNLCWQYALAARRTNRTLGSSGPELGK